MRAFVAVLSTSLTLLAGRDARAQDYRLPLELPEAGERQPYVTAYRDHDSGSARLDWSCGDHTYDGHRGTDLGIGGFAAMDAGSVWVVAAADGVVTFVNDGCFDRCTSGACDCGAGFGNYVRVEHDDGKRTFYGHLMTSTVQVAVGDRVTCGTRLGKVGSSGNSTGPHLHFEPRYSSNVSDDPFGGSCGGPLTFWVSQGNYRALPAEQCEAPPEPEEPPPEPEEPPPEPEEPPPEPEPPAEPPATMRAPELATSIAEEAQATRATGPNARLGLTGVDRVTLGGGCVCVSMGAGAPSTLAGVGLLGFLLAAARAIGARPRDLTPRVRVRAELPRRSPKLC